MGALSPFSKKDTEEEGASDDYVHERKGEKGRKARKRQRGKERERERSPVIREIASLSIIRFEVGKKRVENRK